MSHSPELAAPDWSHADLWGPPRPRRWGPWQLLGAVLVGVLANLAVAGAVIWYLGRHPELDATTLQANPWVLLAGMFALWVVFGGYPLAVTHLSGLRSLAREYGWVFRAKDVLIGLVLGLALRAADLGLGWLAGRFIDMRDADNASWLESVHGVVWVVVFAVGGSIVAPALEELFFRGFVITALRKIGRATERHRTLVAIAGSSVLFGALHVTALSPGGLYVGIVTGSLGALLAAVATRANRLGPAVWTHIAFNATGIALAFLAR